ncbi:MAG: porin [Gammaproteobacteria bacterium]|nr:porin [Gammaproteobacteria bacterium]
MNNSLKKYIRLAGVTLLTLPLVAAGNLFAAEETVEDRIKKLESMVMELKKQVKQQKSEQEMQMTKQEGKMKTAKATSAPKHSYKFGGFIKATGSVSDYSAGHLGAGSWVRDFYIPSVTPVGGTGGSKEMDFSAKESRINFKSKHLLDNGETVATNIEMDFLASANDGNERVSNSYQSRLRHAYFTYGKWLFGQTWSTFQDVGALPEAADFLGASEGVVFNRQPMVRYSNGPWQFSIENPETTVTPYGGVDANNVKSYVTDDNSLPDIVARYNHKAKWGHISAAALVRQLAYETTTIDSTESAIGLSLTGKVKVGKKDDIRFNFATGSGMGRYVALNASNGAVLNASGELEAIDSTVGSVAYRHVWGSGWRSSLILSAINVDNDTALTGTGAIKTINSVQANLLYSPVPKVTFGVGLLNATKELESGVDGDLTRLIFTGKYAF